MPRARTWRLPLALGAVAGTETPVEGVHFGRVASFEATWPLASAVQDGVRGTSADGFSDRGEGTQR